MLITTTTTAAAGTLFDKIYVPPVESESRVSRPSDLFLMDDYVAGFLSGAASENVVVAAGVSGGQDSDVLAIEVSRVLKSRDFRGTFVLIHSDLGLIEHKESLPQCRRLAAHVDAELFVVQPLLPMLERWEKRRVDNTFRFENLERVKLLSPWSSADMKFCTSEEKVAPITQFLKNRFPGKFIINAVGLRREESTNRKKKPVWQENKLLRGKKLQTDGIDWFPILDYLKEHVAAVHFCEHFSRHPVYEKGNERISCVFCVLGSRNDLEVGLTDPYNLQSFNRIVSLEILSTFSFQQSGYLAEVGFDYLSDEQKRGFEICLKKAEERKVWEKQIPKELLFGLDHFPAFQPGLEQARGLAEVRRGIGELLGLNMKYITGPAVYDRYGELLAIKESKEEKAKSKAAKRNKSIESEEAMLGQIALF